MKRRVFAGNEKVKEGRDDNEKSTTGSSIKKNAVIYVQVLCAKERKQLVNFLCLRWS